MGQVLSPKLVKRPSAIVFGFSMGINFFDSNDLLQSSAPFGSAAIILMLGFNPLAAIQTPLIIPPPPTGALFICFICFICIIKRKVKRKEKRKKKKEKRKKKKKS